MDLREIALQLTLKAIDAKDIKTKSSNEGTYEDVNAFNAKQISDFYNSYLLSNPWQNFYP